jgi:hypothetical protein
VAFVWEDGLCHTTRHPVSLPLCVALTSQIREIVEWLLTLQVGRILESTLERSTVDAEDLRRPGHVPTHGLEHLPDVALLHL